MKKRLALVVPVVMISALVGCGAQTAEGSPDSGGEKDIYQEMEGLSGEERTEQLLEAAKDAGEIHIYTSNTDLAAVEEAFTEKYGIKVESYRGNSETVLQKVSTEAKAGSLVPDVIETNAGGLSVMDEQGLLAPYESEYREALRPAAQGDGWSGDRFEVFAVGWNTDLIGPGEEPTSFEDLADPKWKGRISMEMGDVDWYATLWQHFVDSGMSEDDVNELFTAIAANSQVEKGHTTQNDFLVAGKYGVAVSAYTHSLDKGSAKGQPVAWQRQDGSTVEPLIIRASGVAPSATANNPAGALLFIDFLLSSEGQQIIADAHRVTGLSLENDLLEGRDVVVVDDSLMRTDGDEWSERYDDLLRNAG